MRSMKGTIATLAIGTLLGAGSAQALTFPNPATNAFQYGDAYSFSLPILAYQYDKLYGGGVGPGNPYYIASTPGAIQNLVVVATGASGNNLNQNFAGMDNAYPTPSGISGSPIFSTGDPAVAPFDPPGPSTNPVFAGQLSTTWDAQLSALKTFLDGQATGNDLVFFFNNNQVNSGAASNQNLFAWAQIALRDLQGVKPTLYFDFTSHTKNNGGTPGGDPTTYNSPGAPTSGYPFGPTGLWPDNNAPNRDFVLSGGQVCLNSTGTALVSCATPGAIVFNHNLGANQAAYAIFVPELDTILNKPGFDGYDILSLDLRMSALNNGYEQVFIMGANIIHNGLLPIPEPSTIILLGGGLLGLGLYGRRKISK